VKKTAAFKLIIATPVFMLLANYLAIFAQDYAHSITAWFLGYKEHPFNIYFGGRSILNFLVLFNANDNVDYDLIMSAGRMRDLAYIGLAGIGLANGALYFISLRLMKIKLVQHFQLFFYFMLWLNFMNIAQLFSYIPVRVFSESGDAAHIAQGFNISPWWICIILGYAVTYMIWHFFTRTLQRTYDILAINSTFFKAILMMLCAIPLFGYYGVAGFIDNGEIAHFLSAASLFILPGVIAACWPLKQTTSRPKALNQIDKITESITETISETFAAPESTIADGLAMPHLSIDEAHFIENLNAVLGKRDADIRESQKKIKNKLSKNRK
jgi:hypothetical protein